MSQALNRIEKAVKKDKEFKERIQRSEQKRTGEPIEDEQENDQEEQEE